MQHERIVELLPWYVNGTLPPQDRAAVESELATCPLCAAELEQLRQLHAALHEIEKDAPGPSDYLLGRTLARAGAEPQAPATFSLTAWWQRLPVLGKTFSLAAVAIALLLIVARPWSIQPESGVAVEPQPVILNRQEVNAPVGGERAKTLDAVTTTRSDSGLAQRAMGGAPAAAPAPALPAEMSVVPSLYKSIPPGGITRPQLIRTGNIYLIVPDVEAALRQLASVAQLQFGDIVSLDDQTPYQPGIRHSAQVQISVPSDRFDQTMSALAALGTVQGRSISAENVSDQIVDAQARLRNLRRTEGDMLRIMDRAGKIPDVLEVTQQIAQVREQIEQLDAQLQSMQHRVAYSTISIGIQDEKPAATVEPSAGVQIEDAWKAALISVKKVSVRLVSRLLTIIAFAPFWLPLVLIAVFLWRRYMRPV
jgi:hypothetical protein